MRQHITAADINSVEGWFARIDVAVFRFLLEQSEKICGTGDLAEMGVYLGKSAVLIGSYLRPGETFTVIDLFGENTGNNARAATGIGTFSDLTQQQFEANYRRIHDSLPVVVRGSSETIVDHAAHGRHRFVHIDASHHYGHVVRDITAASELLSTNGVVALDDYRAMHTPGVAAATWQAVSMGLVPLVVTPNKFYGTWGEPSIWQKALADWSETCGWRTFSQRIGEHEVLLLTPRASIAERYLPPKSVEPLRAARTRLLQQLRR